MFFFNECHVVLLFHLVPSLDPTSGVGGTIDAEVPHCLG